MGIFVPLRTEAGDSMKVFVSILPQKYFVDKIGGNRVEVSVLVEPGASPHSYEPKPGQMAALTKAAVYFAIGVNFEEVWLKRIASLNPQMLIVHTDRGIKKIPMASLHSHDEKGRETPPGRINLDPHIWTSPPLVRTQAENILKGLIEVDPAGRTAYAANYNAFIDEINGLESYLRDIFSGLEGKEFLVFHPSWGYFARAYGLRQIPVEIEGKEPKPAELHHLIEHAMERGIKVIFVQPQISTKSARTIAKAIGGQVVIADPLAENWTGNLRSIAEKFREALR